MLLALPAPVQLLDYLEQVSGLMAENVLWRVATVSECFPPSSQGLRPCRNQWIATVNESSSAVFVVLELMEAGGINQSLKNFLLLIVRKPRFPPCLGLMVYLVPPSTARFAV